MRDNERTLHTFAVHLLVTCVFCALGLALAMGLSLFVPLVVQLELGGPAEVGPFATRLLELHASFWPVLTTTIFGVAVASLLLYRRMIRPLVRFVRTFVAVGGGTLPAPIGIRRGDYLGHQAEALNRMVAGLAERIDDLKQSHARLDETLHALVERSVDRPGIAELTTEIQELSKGMEDALGRFRSEV